VTAPAKIKLTLSPQAERYVRRDAPVEVRRLAARGALPLAPVELATVLFALTHDPDDEVKSRARESLETLPPTVCDAVLGGETHPAVLAREPARVLELRQGKPRQRHEEDREADRHVDGERAVADELLDPQQEPGRLGGVRRVGRVRGRLEGRRHQGGEHEQHGDPEQHRAPDRAEEVRRALDVLAHR